MDNDASKKTSSRSKLFWIITTSVVGAMISAIVTVVVNISTKDTMEVCFSFIGKGNSQTGIYNSMVGVRNTGDLPIRNFLLGFDTEIGTKITQDPMINVWVSSFSSCELQDRFIDKRSINDWRFHRSVYKCEIINPDETITYGVEYDINTPNLYTGINSWLSFAVSFKGEGYTVEDFVSADMELGDHICS